MERLTFSQFTKDHYKLNFANIIIITKKVVLNLNKGRDNDQTVMHDLKVNCLKSCVKINQLKQSLNI